MRSDIPVEINGIQTISRKIQGSYDSDQFRTAAMDSSTGSAYPSRRLPERPVSIGDPASASSPTPAPGIFALPSTSHSTLHRQLPDVNANNSDLRSSKERKALDFPSSVTGGHDTATSSDVDRVREVEDDDEVDDRPYAKVKITTKKMRKKPREDHPYAKIQEPPAPESDSDNDRALPDDSHQPRVLMSPQQRANASSVNVAISDGVVAPSSSRVVAPVLESASFSPPPASLLRQDVVDGPAVSQSAALPNAENAQHQAHFSGDSQDSRTYRC